jgi:hypothetical protein
MIPARREGCWTFDMRGVRRDSTQFRPTGSAPSFRLHKNWPGRKHGSCCHLRARTLTTTCNFPVITRDVLNFVQHVLNLAQKCSQLGPIFQPSIGGWGGRTRTVNPLLRSQLRKGCATLQVVRGTVRTILNRRHALPSGPVLCASLPDPVRACLPAQSRCLVTTSHVRAQLPYDPCFQISPYGGATRTRRFMSAIVALGLMGKLRFGSGVCQSVTQDQRHDIDDQPPAQ